MNILRFIPFVPKMHDLKDFSDLEMAIRETERFREGLQHAETAFVRGSSVSSYNEGLVFAHGFSDIDVYLISRSSGQSWQQYREDITTKKSQNTTTSVPVELNTLDLGKLIEETESGGERSIVLMNSLVMMSIPLENEELYQQVRSGSLFSYMRVGLAHYDEDFAAITPSGAMKAVNDGLLRINRLRWWSIQYAFQDSETSEQNKLHFYQDVDNMLWKNFTQIGMFEDEPLYGLPDNLALYSTLPKIWCRKAEFYVRKSFGKMRKFPPISLNDMEKLAIKGFTLATGVFYGKADVESIFAPD